MRTTRLRGRLVVTGALLLAAAFTLRFLESPLAAWSAAHANAASDSGIAAFTLIFSIVPTVLQIVAMSLASAALIDASVWALPYIPLLWAAVHVLLAWLGRPELRNWAAAHLSLPLWRLWAGLSAGQVSALSHGFGARQVMAALLGAAIAAACLTPLRREGRARVTGITLVCLRRPPPQATVSARGSEEGMATGSPAAGAGLATGHAGRGGSR